MGSNQRFTFRVAAVLVIATLATVTVVVLMAKAERLTPEWLDGNAATLFGSILTAASLVIGVFIVLHQMSAQHESSRSLQEANKRQDLQLRVYESISDKSSALEVSAKRAAIVVELLHLRTKPGTYSYPAGVGLLATTSTEAMELDQEVGKAFDSLRLEVDKWSLSVKGVKQIVDDCVSAEDARGAAYFGLFEDVLWMLPSSPPAIPTGTVTVDDTQAAAATRAINTYVACCNSLAEHAQKLRVQSQACLVGEIFR
jgi:hypothetical protein